MKDTRIGDWMETFTGVKFYPIDPRIEDIRIQDIAHALSLQCRYGGHTKFHYSVAQHSIIMSYMVSPENALSALLHDATEAYLVDVPRPVKASIPDYKTIEKALEWCISERFGVPFPMPDEVKQADNLMIRVERKWVMNESSNVWTQDALPLPSVVVGELPWQDVRAMFLERFNALAPSPSQSGKEKGQ